MAETRGTPPIRPSSTRRLLELAWCGTAVAYCLVRIVLARHFLGDHVNVVGFAIVELASVLPDAYGTCRLVGALVDRDSQAAGRWGLVAAAGFIAPDVYVLATARHAPAWLYLVVAVWMTAAALFAAHHISTAVHERRAERLRA